jgi:DNA-binding MarR family transcriptional regulator
VTDPELLGDTALAIFKLNGQFLALAEELAGPVGLTAAWWQVLGAVLPAPLPVAGIAREMGITRQSVQRIADILAERGLAEYRDNPAHRRAKLLAPTAAGRAAVARIAPAQAEAAAKICAALGRDPFEAARDALRALSAVLDTVSAPGPVGNP